MRGLGTGDLPELQRLFEASSAYFEAVNGEPTRPDEARREFEDRPPPELSFGRIAVYGFDDPDGRLVAMASVLGDLVVPGVWHLGLFLVSTAWHGTGAAQAVHHRLERLAIEGGAEWLRLGVVAGNGRAERFWQKVGYREVRQRQGVEVGTLVHTIRVMVKPLAGGSLEDYLGRMARDRPE